MRQVASILVVTLVDASVLLICRTASAQSTPPPPDVSHVSSQSSFSITPPPLGYPHFRGALIEDGEEAAAPETSEAESAPRVTHGVGAIYLAISSDSASMKGVGFAYTPRLELDIGAVDLSVSGFRFGGDVSDLDMSFWGASFGAAGELNIIDLGWLDVVGFGGLTFTYTNGFFKITLPWGPLATMITTGVHVASTLWGPVGGLQVHLRPGQSWIVTPHVMVSSLGGTTKVSDNTGLWAVLNTSSDMPRFLQTTFGLDIMYAPLSLTLSGFTQLSGKSGDAGGFHTTLLTLSYAI